MRYYICRYKKKISEHASQHALDLAFNKSRMKEIYKVVMPEFIIGTKLYDIHGEYGEIVSETEHLFYIKRLDDADSEDCMIIKKIRLEQAFINGVFTTGEDNGL